MGFCLVGIWGICARGRSRTNSSMLNLFKITIDIQMTDKIDTTN